MKKLTSTKYSAASFSVAMLLLRIFSGGLMLSHGFDKLINFASKKETFMSFLGLGSTISLSLTIFAEFFCALFLIIGLFSRMVVIPLIIVMCVALFVSHGGDFFGKGEKAALFLGAYLTILLVGPGRFSVDAMTGK